MRARNLAIFAALIPLICLVFSVVPGLATRKTVDSDGREHALSVSKAVPNTLNYQGFLVDATDSSAVTATLEMTFRLFDAETKGVELWSETHPTVEVSNGLFQVLLGSVIPFPGSLFDGSALWLQSEVGTEVLVPRKPLVSVAYSQRAQMADHAVLADTSLCIQPDDDWTISGNHMYSAVPGSVGIGTTSPGAKLDVGGDVNAEHLYRIGGNAVLSASGTGITLVGVDAGANNTGSLATFVGYDAGHNNQGDDNTFLGNRAGYTNTTGLGNTFLGEGAGYSNTTGDASTFVGRRAGSSNMTGNCNTFMGYNAGFSNTAGHDNTFLGWWAGYSNTIGDYNTFVGYDAGRSNTEGKYNTFIGKAAGHSNITGVGNVFIGHEAGRYETGSNKLYMANGADSSDVLIYGDFSMGNVGVGTLSPAHTLDVAGDVSATTYYGDGSNLTGIAGGPDNDWVVSGNSMYSAVSGKVGIGTTSPGEKLHVGGSVKVDSTLFANDVSSNSPLQLQTAGTTRVYIDDTSGNVGVGKMSPATKLDVAGDINADSLYKIGGNTVLSVSGTENIFVGIGAGSNNISVGGTFVGDSAGYNNQGGANTFLGRSAGYSNTTGAGNVFIGCNAGHDEAGSNKLYIANGADTSAVLIYGDFSTGRVGMGTLSPVSLLEVENHSNSPDMRLDAATGGAAYLRFSQDNDQKAFIRINTIGDLQLDTEASGSEAMTILNSNANVGIGTTSPARRLHVSDVMRLEPRDTAPGSPSEGDMYMDSTTHKLMVYDGSIWQACW